MAVSKRCAKANLERATMTYTKTLAVSLVSLLACLAGQSALGITTSSNHVIKHPTKTSSSITITLLREDNVVRENNVAQFQEFKLIPRVNLWGFGGDDTRGEGQAMIPIWGDAAHAFYFLTEGIKEVNTSEWMGGLGLGFRQVYNERIFGGYLIGDYQNSEENNGFYIANPGIEMLSQTWDVDINGFFPFKQKNSFEIHDFIASEDLGITNFVHFSGHNELDHMFRVFTGSDGHSLAEEAGRGFDAEIGRTIPRIENLRMYLGGYHFDTDDIGSINGIEGRAVYEFNGYFALEGEYNYDNVKHSQAVLGLRFTLGGYNAEEKKRYGISTRLFDPIEHDLVIGSTGRINIGTASKTIDLGETTIHGKLWFFKQLTATTENDIGPGFVQGSGTFEDPYVGFTPANVGDINPNLGTTDKFPLLYFAPGNYNFDGTGHGFQNGRFTLPSGWGMFGRADNTYESPAIGINRARFAGGLDLDGSTIGGDPTTLNSIAVINAKGATSDIDFSNAALHVMNANNVVLQNVDIENGFSPAAPNAPAFTYGIYAKNSTLNFEQLDEISGGDTEIIGLADSHKFGNAVGLYTDSAVININGGMTTMSGTAVTDLAAVPNESIGIGILATNNSFVNFKDGKNSVSGIGSGTAQDRIGVGIDVENSTLSFVNGTNAITSDGEFQSIGIAAIGTSVINFENRDEKVTIGATGGSVLLPKVGISADNSVSIRDPNRNEFTNATKFNMYNYINFTGSGSGDAVVWDGHFSPPLPWPTP